MFRDRRDAGRRLARELRRFKDMQPVVLALPRGGLPVGHEIAVALDAPLDVVLVRKIGAPWQPELAVAAVVDGERPETVLNRDIMNLLQISDDYVKNEAERQLREIERRRRAYVGERRRAEVSGHTAILVDDGIATGATMRCALKAVRRAAPQRLVLAVPVAPAATVESLREEADEVVCLMTPADFFGISQHYSEFPQLEDREVVEILDRAAARFQPTAPERP